MNGLRDSQFKMNYSKFYIYKLKKELSKDIMIDNLLMSF